MDIICTILNLVKYVAEMFFFGRGTLTKQTRKTVHSTNAFRSSLARLEGRSRERDEGEQAKRRQMSNEAKKASYKRLRFIPFSS